MTTLSVNRNGFGTVTNEQGTVFTVLKADGMWNLSMGDKCGFTTWIKENVKRLSTIQRFANEHELNLVIVEEA